MFFAQVSMVQYIAHHFRIFFKCTFVRCLLHAIQTICTTIRLKLKMVCEIESLRFLRRL